MHPVNSKKELEELKVGEPVLVREYQHGWSHHDNLFMGKVIKRTATRITVMYSNKFERIFTTDGETYPRARGYARSPSLVPANSENLEKYRRSYAIRKVKHYAYQLNERISNMREFFEKMSQSNIDNLANALEFALAAADKVDTSEVGS